MDRSERPYALSLSHEHSQENYIKKGTGPVPFFFACAKDIVCSSQIFLWSVTYVAA